MKELRSVLDDYYCEWRNNYLTYEKFANDHGLTESQAIAVLSAMKEIFYSHHPEA